MAGNAAASVAAIVDKARTSWLKNNEVLELLESYAAAGLSVCAEPPVRPAGARAAAAGAGEGGEVAAGGARQAEVGRHRRRRGGRPALAPSAASQLPPSPCTRAGGQLFLFDRRVCRFFRRDGHSWRKKPDGKTIRETHEKLKGAAGRGRGSGCAARHLCSAWLGSLLPPAAPWRTTPPACLPPAPQSAMRRPSTATTRTPTATTACSGAATGSSTPSATAPCWCTTCAPPRAVRARTCSSSAPPARSWWTRADAGRAASRRGRRGAAAPARRTCRRWPRSRAWRAAW